MKNILKKLYDGEICPIEEIPESDEYEKYLADFHKASTTFMSSLKPEQRRAYDQYDNARMLLEAVRNVESFERAFRLGAILMLDILEGGMPDEELK